MRSKIAIERQRLNGASDGYLLYFWRLKIAGDLETRRMIGRRLALFGEAAVDSSDLEVDVRVRWDETTGHSEEPRAGSRVVVN
jgi:hypothetical protein